MRDHKYPDRGGSRREEEDETHTSRRGSVETRCPRKTGEAKRGGRNEGANSKQAREGGSGGDHSKSGAFDSDTDRPDYAHLLIGCDRIPAAVANINASISMLMQVIPLHLFALGLATPAIHHPIADDSALLSDRKADRISLSTPNDIANTTLIKLLHHALDCQGNGEGVERHHPV